MICWHSSDDTFVINLDKGVAPIRHQATIKVNADFCSLDSIDIFIRLSTKQTLNANLDGLISLHRQWS